MDPDPVAAKTIFLPQAELLDTEETLKIPLPDWQPQECRPAVGGEVRLPPAGLRCDQTGDARSCRQVHVPIQLLIPPDMKPRTY